MKNYEKYEDKIRERKGMHFCDEFVRPYILGRDSCDGVSCEKCSMLQLLWLLKDYEEPEVDWNKVEVDTPILVRNSEDEDWYRRYFAEYKDGVVYTWVNGCTSWTAFNSSDVIKWKYAKLAESEDE